MEITIFCPLCNQTWMAHPTYSLGEHIMKAVDILIDEKLKEEK